MAIASLILGIIAVANGNIICAILALVFSSKVDPADAHFKFAKVGKITGIIGLVCSILLMLALIAYFGIIGAAAVLGSMSY